MNLTSTTLRVAAVASGLTVLTTLVVHLLPTGELPDDLAARTAVLVGVENLFRLRVVLLHCLLVLIAGAGVVWVRWREAPGWAALGALGYLTFALFEWLRTALVLFYLTPLRQQLLDGQLSIEALKGVLEGFAGVNSALFFLFIAGFALGNLGLGMSLIDGKGLTRVLAIVLLIWCVQGMTGVVGRLSELPLDVTPPWWGYTYQPAARLLLAVWLWQQARAASASAS